MPVIDIPLDGSLSLDDPRTVKPGQFVTLDNATYQDGGWALRHGHELWQVLDNNRETSTTVPEATRGWLYGFGEYDTAKDGLVLQKTQALVQPIYSVFTLGNETLAWDRFRLFSKTEDRWNKVGWAILPSATETSVLNHEYSSGSFGVQTKGTNFDVAVGRSHRVYTWLESNALYLSVTTLDGTVVLPRTSAGVSGLNQVRVTYSETGNEAGYFFVTYHATASTELRCFVFPDRNLVTYLQDADFASDSVQLVATTLGANTPFDVRATDDGISVITVSSAVQLRYVRVGFDSSVDGMNLNFSALTPQDDCVAIDYCRGTILVCWVSGGDVRASFYTVAGALVGAAITVTTTPTTVGRLTCAMGWMLHRSGPGYGKAVVAVYDDTSNNTIFSVLSDNTIPVANATLLHVMPTHQAFRVGQELFVTVQYRHPTASLQAQTATLHVDISSGTMTLSPVSSCLRGASFVDTFSAANAWVRSTAPVPGSSYTIWNTPEDANIFKFCQAEVTGKSRITSAGVSTQDRDGATLLEYDFGHKPDFVNVNGTGYLSGSVVRAYDGVVLTTAGHLTFPYVISAASATSGSLTPSTTYYGRWYLCYRDAKGNTYRSAALTHSITLGVGEDEIVWTIPAIPLCERGDYFWEYYRTVAASTTFYKVATVTSALATARSANLVYNDTLADSTADNMLIDPAPAYTSSGFGLLDAVPPPNCAGMSQGQDRIWFHGGAVPKNQVAFSKLYQTGDALSWNEGLTHEIPGLDEVTGVRALNENVVVFRRSGIWLFNGSGQDNLGQGFFNPAAAVETDTGSLSRHSVVSIPLGIVFHGESGFKLLNRSNNVVDLGLEVDSNTQIVCSAKSSLSRTVRFTANDATYVLDYSDQNKPRWSRWALQINGSCEAHGKVYCASEHGVLVENQDTFTDGPRSYELVLRTGWIPLTNMVGEGRARYWGLVGGWLDSHRLYGKLKYNYNEQFSETFEWRPNEAYTVLDYTGNPLATLTDVNEPDSTYGSGTPSWDFHGPYLYSRHFLTSRVASFQLELRDGGPGNQSFRLAGISVEHEPRDKVKRHGPRNNGPFV